MTRRLKRGNVPEREQRVIYKLRPSSMYGVIRAPQEKVDAFFGGRWVEYDKPLSEVVQVCDIISAYPHVMKDLLE